MRGQASTESIILIAAGLIIIIILTGIFMGIRSTASAGYESGQAEATVEDIVAAATSVWRQSPGARQQVFVQIPVNTVNLTTRDNYISITRLTTGGNSVLLRPLGFNITGNLTVDRSNYWVNVENIGTGVRVSVAP